MELKNQEKIYRDYQKFKNSKTDDPKSNLKFVKNLVIDLDEIFNETIKQVFFFCFKL